MRQVGTLILMLVTTAAVAMSAETVHRHRCKTHPRGGGKSTSPHHSHTNDPTYEFKVDVAIDDCRIPSGDCRASVKKAMMCGWQLPGCSEIEFDEMSDCLDAAIIGRMPREARTNWTSKTGRICCERANVGEYCKRACRSALYAPTLPEKSKRSKVELFCDKHLTTGDGEVMRCLDTMESWLKRQEERET